MAAALNQPDEDLPMASSPRLGGIPEELVEVLVSLVGFHDACSLRLTGRELAYEASQGVFRTHFRTKTIRVSQTQDLVLMTRPGNIGCHVQHLSLTVTVPVQPNREGVDDGLRFRLEPLGQALKQLRINSPLGRLVSLSLAVDGVREDGNIVPAYRVQDYEEVSDAAAALFETAVRALGESNIPVDRFDVFGGVVRCSLACDRIATTLNGPPAPLQSVKQLSISLSPHMGDLNGPSGIRFGETGAKSASGVCRFLGLCSSLQELQLH